MAKAFISLLLGLLFSPMVDANSLSPIEQKIHDKTASYQKEQLLLLETLVNINSGTENLAGVRQVGEKLRPAFEALGFKTRWVEEPAAMNRAGTLVAQQTGTKGKRLLLIGHLDTIFPKDSPFQQFKQQSNSATGPGVIDDKGGDLVILYALKTLQALHTLNDATITVVLTGDEENSGKPTSISRKPLLEIAKQSDIALDFEDGIQNKASIARRGVSDWTLKTGGNGMHAATIFQKTTGDGAAFELARILNTMRTQLSDEKYLSFNPGFIMGGTTIQYDKNTSQGTVFGKKNAVAKTAMAQGDLRFLTQAQKIQAEKKISTIVNHSLLGTTASVTFQDGIPSMPPTANNSALLKKYSQASIDLGYGPIEPLDPGLRGAGDISHIASFVSASLAGLGPVGAGAHSEKETIDVHSLPIQTERAALLIYRLTR